MAWNSGDRVIVRGADWRVIQSTRFSDCEALDVFSDSTNTALTLLLPFDRPRSPPSPRFQVVSAGCWARLVSAAIRTMHPFGGLRYCPCTIQLLPYQLEPALAVLRHGARRVLVADDVGLGKTIEAGLIVREVAMRQHLSRTLIVSPAAVRDQWRQELASLFEIHVVDATAGWLRRSARELPPDVNPWSLPGVYLASLDFVKRPEALLPLEAVRLDLLVVDEAHAATPGSDRLAAVQALAARARVVVLLTATPHSGDDEQFRALCGIGAQPGSAPVVIFRRTRAGTPLGTRTARSRLLAVRQSDAEGRMHRMVEEYARRIWTESRARGDARGELAATILRKRALSSPASIALSLRRRLDLLAGRPGLPAQLALPLEEEPGIEEDSSPAWALGCAPLEDREGERRMLEQVSQQSELAAKSDSKTRALLRLLRRVREPAIVFTEYRDTAAHLGLALRAAGHRVCELHGGMSGSDRSAATATFRTGDHILVATDAASEGLNLHHRCRLVVHFELPWAPLRLHQRRGRVDRIGQQRRVHEVALVARDTCEHLVFVPLLRRLSRSRAFVDSPLADVLTESRVAARVLGGAPLTDRLAAPRETPLPTCDLSAEAAREVARLVQLRRIANTASNDSTRSSVRSRAIIPVARTKRGWKLGRHLTLVLGISLRTAEGVRCESSSLVLAIDLGKLSWSRRQRLLRREVEQIVSALVPYVDSIAAKTIAGRLSAVAPLYSAADRARRERDASLMHALRSTARELVQPGLFDRRAMRAAAARRRSSEIALEEMDAAPSIAQDGTRPLEGACELVAVLVGCGT